MGLDLVGRCSEFVRGRFIYYYCFGFFVMVVFWSIVVCGFGLYKFFFIYVVVFLGIVSDISFLVKGFDV